ncbi:MAG: SMI1/KNR4 family protein [Tepidisphaera sp.]
MSRLEELRQFAGWKSPSQRHSVGAIESALGLRLPADFASFLRTSGGFEGFFGQSYLVLLDPADIPRANVEACISEVLPGLVMFGGNGGGEWFCIDTRTGRYVMAPSIGGPEHVLDEGATFEEFLDRVHSDQLFDRKPE